MEVKGRRVRISQAPPRVRWKYTRTHHEQPVSDFTALALTVWVPEEARLSGTEPNSCTRPRVREAGACPGGWWSSGQTGRPPGEQQPSNR